jgi:hypothetical protein
MVQTPWHHKGAFQNFQSVDQFLDSKYFYVLKIFLSSNCFYIVGNFFLGHFLFLFFSNIKLYSIYHVSKSHINVASS